jgi:hypothetical protein
MAGGVRLATGYITIEAETSQVPKQLKDALQQASSDVVKPAGTQMGKDIATGIREGLKVGGSGGVGGTVSGGIGKQIQADITKGLDPKKTGETIGKDVSTGIREGMKQGGAGGTTGGIGKQIEADITKGVDAKKAGEQIGKDIGTGAREGAKKTGQDVGKDVGTGVKEQLDVSLKDALKPMQDWAKGVKDEIKKGDIKGAFSDVGDVVANTGSIIGSFGKVVGADFSAMERFGGDLATKLDRIGDSLQPAVDKITKFTAGINQLRSGETADGLRAVSDAMRGVVPDNVLDNAQNVLDKYKETHQSITDTVNTTKEFLGDVGLGAVGSRALAMLGESVAPATAIAGSAIAGNYLANQWAPSLPGFGREGKALGGKQGPRPLWWPIEQGATMPFRWAEQVFGTPEPEPPPFAPTPELRSALLGGTGKVTGAPSVGGVPIPGITAAAPTIVAAPAPAGGGPRIEHATESIGTASISVGSASVSGVSVPAPAAASSSSGGGGYWWGSGAGSKPSLPGMLLGGSRDLGGPIAQDEYSRLHAGEHVLTAADVDALGGQDQVSAMRAGLSSGLGKTPAGGAPPGGNEAAGAAAGTALDAMRTAGFVPAAAGQQTVAGTSSLAGLLNLGNQAVSGLIDAGASAAQTAISMAGAAGTFGAGGQAAGAAAGLPIQMAANEAKRASTYGFQLASIWSDALVEQLFPFGAPRWIGYDYTKFMPQMDVGSIATTTVEKAMQAASGKGQQTPGQMPGGPVQPEQMAGMQVSAGPAPKFGEPYKTPAPGGAPPGRADVGAGIAAGLAAGGPQAPGAAAPSVAPMQAPPQSTSPAPPPPVDNANPFASLFQFDDGGWWMPGQAGINAGTRPELVLSPDQLDAATKGSRSGWGRGDTYNITAVDADDVAKQIDARKKLAMMQYGSRP